MVGGDWQGERWMGDDRRRTKRERRRMKDGWGLEDAGRLAAGVRGLYSADRAVDHHGCGDVGRPRRGNPTFQCGKRFERDFLPETPSPSSASCGSRPAAQGAWHLWLAGRVRLRQVQCRRVGAGEARLQRIGNGANLDSGVLESDCGWGNGSLPCAHRNASGSAIPGRFRYPKT